MYCCHPSPWRTPSLGMTHARRDMAFPHGTAKPPTAIGEAQIGLNSSTEHATLAATVQSAPRLPEPRPVAAQKPPRQSRIEMLATGARNSFNAGTILLLRLAAPLLLLGCSAASDTRAGASPRIRS